MLVGLHPPAACVVAPGEGNVDATFIGFGATLDDRPITLADLALLEQFSE